MYKTPGFISPSQYSSQSELENELKRRAEISGFTKFDPSEFVEDVIRHYGVKGMKWGVIRDRLSGNESPQARDERRLKKLQDRANKLERQDKLKAKKLVDLKPSKDYSDAKFVLNKAKVSGTSTISNQDLRKAIARMNLEKQYFDLKSSEHDRSLIGKGKKIVGSLLLGAMKDMAANATRPQGDAGSYSWGPSSSPMSINGSVGRPRAIGS